MESFEENRHLYCARKFHIGTSDASHSLTLSLCLSSQFVLNFIHVNLIHFVFIPKVFNIIFIVIGYFPPISLPKGLLLVEKGKLLICPCRSCLLLLDSCVSSNSSSGIVLGLFDID